MPEQLVEQFMCRDTLTIRPDGGISELEELLLDNRAHGAPVVNEQGRLVGVVSQTDLLNWVRSRTGDAPEAREPLVEELMSSQVYCIGPDRPITEAAAMMIGKWIHRLVVVDGELKVVGMLSAIDLLHALPGAREALEASGTHRP